MSGGGMNMEGKKEELEISICLLRSGWVFWMLKVLLEEWVIMVYFEIVLMLVVEYWEVLSGM